MGLEEVPAISLSTHAPVLLREGHQREGVGWLSPAEIRRSPASHQREGVGWLSAAEIRRSPASHQREGVGWLSPAKIRRSPASHQKNTNCRNTTLIACRIQSATEKAPRVRAYIPALLRCVMRLSGCINIQY